MELVQKICEMDHTPLPASGIEQRKAERVKARFSVAITASDPVDGDYRVRSAILRDLSLLGACVSTRDTLEPGQWVDVCIPTEGCLAESGLPHELTGEACVERIERRPHHTQRVGMRFGPTLAESMDFATYLAYLMGA